MDLRYLTARLLGIHHVTQDVFASRSSEHRILANDRQPQRPAVDDHDAVRHLAERHPATRPRVVEPAIEPHVPELETLQSPTGRIDPEHAVDVDAVPRATRR